MVGLRPRAVMVGPRPRVLLTPPLYVGTKVSEEHAAYLSRQKRGIMESYVYPKDTLDMLLHIYQATLHPEESNLQLKQCNMKVIIKLGIQYIW